MSCAPVWAAHARLVDTQCVAGASAGLRRAWRPFPPPRVPSFTRRTGVPFVLSAASEEQLRKELRDWDLWGPLVICLFLSV